MNFSKKTSLALLFFSLALAGAPPRAEAISFVEICKAGMRAILGKSGTSRPVTSVTSVELGRRLGAGSGGAVYEALGTIPGDPTPLKVIVKDLTPTFASAEQVERAARQIKEEFDFYSKVHPGEAVLLRVEGNLVMVTPLFANAAGSSEPAPDLKKFWANNPGKAGAAKFRDTIAEGAIANLEKIHKANVVHGDIKPQNLLVASDGKVRIIDYGIAGEPGTEDGGLSLAYTSPARRHFDDEKRAMRNDVYAMGITLLESEMGGFRQDLPAEYSVDRFSLVPSPSAWRKVPENFPGLSPERAMAHFTYVKQTAADYRDLLAVSKKPAEFKKVYARLWLKAFKQETDPVRQDYLISELYMAPGLGPSLLKAMGDPAITKRVLDRGREVRGFAARDFKPTMGWHAEMSPMIDAFLRASP